MSDLPPPVLLTDADTISQYARDESSYAGYAAGVIHVRDGDEMAAVLARATAAGIPVTISARRTSLTGAAVPEGGWVVVLPDASSPDQVQVDVAAREATAPAQVLLSDVETAVERVGLFFPPDPTSRKTCSLGGAVACNASGARSFGFGPTGRWVVGLTVILADGQRVHLRRGEHPPQADGTLHLPRPVGGPLVLPAPPVRRTDVKNAMGYALAADDPDLLDLFIGSEGTLGFIETVTVRLLDRQPVFSALCFFDSEDNALGLVETLQSAPPEGVAPMSVEWFDAAALALAGERHPRLNVPKNAVAALFVEQRHAKGAEDDVALAWYEALVAAGAPDDEAYLRVGRTKADGETFREFRHAVPESINALARSRGLRKLGTDLAWPRGALREMVAEDRAALTDIPAALGAEVAAAFAVQWGRPLPVTLDYATFGHIGDNHVHLNLLPHDAAEAAAGKLIYDHLSRRCAARGGAISGEHGIGKAKRAMLAEVTPAADLARMRTIKNLFDPVGILAPGNILPVV